MPKQDVNILLFGAFVLIVILAIVFTLDDLTIIGEILDPLEYIAIAVLAYYVGKKL